jgi:hypothetical protein
MTMKTPPTELGSLLDTTHDERMPMSKDITTLLLALMTNGSDDGAYDPGSALSRHFVTSPIHNIFLSRIKAYAPDAKFSDGIAAFVPALCDRPGFVVLWCHTIFKMWQKNPDRPVSLGDLCETFPMGFPTDCGAERIWGAQKDRGANLIDDPKNWI